MCQMLRLATGLSPFWWAVSTNWESLLIKEPVMGCRFWVFWHTNWSSFFMYTSHRKIDESIDVETTKLESFVKCTELTCAVWDLLSDVRNLLSSLLLLSPNIIRSKGLDPAVTTCSPFGEMSLVVRFIWGGWNSDRYLRDSLCSSCTPVLLTLHSFRF
jgi:hypothetical protein